MVEAKLDIAALLKTPTNNFGLAMFFKKFVILNEDMQKKHVRGELMV